MRGYNLSSTFNKILGFQSAFRTSVFNPPFFRSMSSSPINTTMDPEINRTLSYWFDGPSAHLKWYAGHTTDIEIKSQFSTLVQLARTSQLSSWESTPQGSLAVVILLDQFSRNLYRGTPDSFSADPLAFRVTTEAIAKGYHREVSRIQEIFFLMPLMHSETLIGQLACVGLFESLDHRCKGLEVEENSRASLAFAKRHMAPILKFGRFPSRNEILGRISSPEEVKWLEEHPHGF